MTSAEMNYRAALDSILPLVEKPARYVGGEWNAVRKTDDDIQTRIALCFPDTYEIGMSHLGLKILYSLLNKKDGWAAERVYAPWPDMEAKLREREIPLLSLESYTPLCEFDGDRYTNACVGAVLLTTQGVAKGVLCCRTTALCGASPCSACTPRPSTRPAAAMREA